MKQVHKKIETQVIQPESIESNTFERKWTFEINNVKNFERKRQKKQERELVRKPKKWKERQVQQNKKLH